MSEQSERKRVILSGIQPTGTFTLGNYIGAVRNWAKLQDQFDCLYMVADLHALTVRQEPAALRRHTCEAAAMLLAAGIDPARSILFVQSHVPAHTQLNWILCCNAQFGELSRMTQFKDKSAKHPRQRQRRPVHLSGPDGGGYPDLQRRPGPGGPGPDPAPGAGPATWPSGSTTHTAPPSTCPRAM